MRGAVPWALSAAGAEVPRRRTPPGPRPRGEELAGFLEEGAGLWFGESAPGL